MNQIRLTALLGAALLTSAASGADQAPPAQPTHFSRCEASGNGVEYRTYLPDGQRFVFISVRVLKGIHPSVFVFFDKNFEGKANLLNKSDPLVSWWLDRSRPMEFSADKIRIGWREHGVWHWMTSLVSSDNEEGLAQAIRGLSPVGDHFEGMGSNDNNTFAFQSRIEMQDFDGDEFSVFVPAVSYDGVTVAVPEVHFTETDETPVVKC